MAKLNSGTRIYGTANVDTYFYDKTYTIVNATGRAGSCSFGY